MRFPLWVGVVLAAIGTTAGVALLQLGLARTPSGLAIASSIVLTITLQPPIKLAAGYLLGVRCCHFFFFGIETNTG